MPIYDFSEAGPAVIPEILRSGGISGYGDYTPRPGSEAPEVGKNNPIAQVPAHVWVRMLGEMASAFGAPAIGAPVSVIAGGMQYGKEREALEEWKQRGSPKDEKPAMTSPDKLFAEPAIRGIEQDRARRQAQMREMFGQKPQSILPAISAGGGGSILGRGRAPAGPSDLAALLFQLQQGKPIF